MGSQTAGHDLATKQHICSSCVPFCFLTLCDYSVLHCGLLSYFSPMTVIISSVEFTFPGVSYNLILNLGQEKNPKPCPIHFPPIWKPFIEKKKKKIDAPILLES